MVKYKNRQAKAIITILIAIIGILVLAPVACTEDTINPNQNSSPPAPQPPPPLPEKGNPKIDSTLNRLVSAESRGEAASFAGQHGLTLKDGRIRVVIECVAGEIEAATEAAISTGAKVETSYKDLLQVTVPVSSLSTLAEAESIRFIRLPQQPLPAPGG